MKSIGAIFWILIVVSLVENVYSQQPESESISINNFMVQGSLFKNNQISIVATTAEDQPLQNLNGTFNFSINGFEQSLIFTDGVAIIPQAITKSTFLYLRHENESGTQGKLYYLISKYDTINPIKISWVILIIIPAIIILFAMMFRKFIIIGGILLLLLLYFNSSKGLNIPTFFDTVFDGLKNMI